MKKVLMSCPFCGSDAEFVYDDHDYGMGAVNCTNASRCGIYIYDDHDSAISKWNSRSLNAHMEWTKRQDDHNGKLL